MFNQNLTTMKLKQLKVTKSASLLSDEEMKFVIGGAGLDPIPEGLRLGIHPRTKLFSI